MNIINAGTTCYMHENNVYYSGFCFELYQVLINAYLAMKFDLFLIFFFFLKQHDAASSSSWLAQNAQLPNNLVVLVPKVIKVLKLDILELHNRVYIDKIAAL